jgi:hypothetical protein
LNGDNVVDVSDFNRWLENRWTVRAAAPGGNQDRIPRAPLAHHAAAVASATEPDVAIDPPTRTKSRDRHIDIAIRQEIAEMPLRRTSQQVYRHSARELYFARWDADPSTEALPAADEIEDSAQALISIPVSPQRRSHDR